MTWLFLAVIISRKGNNMIQIWLTSSILDNVKFPCFHFKLVDNWSDIFSLPDVDYRNKTFERLCLKKNNHPHYEPIFNTVLTVTICRKDNDLKRIWFIATSLNQVKFPCFILKQFVTWLIVLSLPNIDHMLIMHSHTSCKYIMYALSNMKSPQPGAYTLAYKCKQVSVSVIPTQVLYLQESLV